MPWSCIQSDFIELGIRNKRSVEKQKLEGRKIEIEARKIEIDARKIGDQKRLTCQKHKVKERNVANDYEKYISKLSFHACFCKDLFLIQTDSHVCI